MGLPQLKSCCFVFSLKTGCIVMGSINAVGSFTLLALMIVLAAEVGAIDVSKEYDGNLEKQAGVTGLYAMSIVLVFMFLIKFLFDVVFVYGVCTKECIPSLKRDLAKIWKTKLHLKNYQRQNQERPHIIKAYMIMWIVFVLLSVFIFFLNSPNISFGTIFTEVMYIGHNAYTILLCNSFYKQLNSREEV